jgi:hypothetical protein
MGLRQRTAAGLSVGHLPTDWNRQATALVPPALPERLGWRADRLLLTKEEYRETNADGSAGAVRPAGSSFHSWPHFGPIQPARQKLSPTTGWR